MRLLLLFSTFFTFSHLLTAQQGTTEEEYRYLTKGYAYQQEMGLDATKDGYAFHDLYKATNEVQFVGMYRNGWRSPQAVLCIFPGSTPDYKYLCLPNNTADAQVAALYEQDKTRILNYNNHKLFDAAMVELFFYQMGSSPNSNQPVANTPAAYDQQEVFTARGGNPEPLVATASSAPAYPVNPQRNSDVFPAQESNTAANTWTGIPLPSINTTNPTPTYSEAEARQSTLKLDFQLDNRAIAYQPAIVTDTSKKGTVVVKLCVDQNGEVISSKFTQKGSTTFDPQLIEMALGNAGSLRFQPSSIAEQCGTISYTFNL